MTDPPPGTLPNVVVMVVHDLGDYLGCYGRKAVTPNLDRLPEAEVEIWPAWMDTPGLRYDLAGFTGEVNNMDRGIGTILAALRTHGFADDTLVVFTTDHGIDFPRAKGTLYDAGIRTALLMRLPGGARAGTTVGGLSSHVDILPTLLDYCDAPGAAEMQGTSLRPLIEGRRAAVHDQIFAEESTLPNNVMRAVRTERYKLIRNFSRGRRSHVGVCAGGRTEIDTGDFYFADRPAYELYDVAADPAESCNLSGSPQCREEESRLRGELERWMKETDDPAPSGSIRRPPDEFERFRKAHSQSLNRHTQPFGRAFGSACRFRPPGRRKTRKGIGVLCVMAIPMFPRRVRCRVSCSRYCPARFG